MGGRDRAEGTFEFVELLERRWDLLAALVEREREQPELVEALDVSKSTVYRGIKELREADLITQRDGGYGLTTTGELLMDRYERFMTDVDAAVRAGDLLAYLPDPLEIDPAFLRGAMVETASPPDNAAPARRIEELLADATRFRGLARAHTQADAPDVYRERVRDGMTATFVFEAEFLAYLQSEVGIDDVLGHDRVTVYRVEEVPCGLFLLDREDGTTAAALLVYDDEKMLRGVVVNDAPPAIEWAESAFERYRERATRVE